MNQSEVIHVIDKFQNEFDINSIKYKGKNVWPILRYYFALVLMKSGSAEAVKTEALTTSEKEAANSSPKLNKILSVLNLPALNINYKSQQKKIASLDSEILFVSPATEAYPDKIDDKKYSRYLDPYIETLGKRKKIIKLQLSKPGQDFEQNYIPVVNIPEEALLLKINTSKKLSSIFTSESEKPKFSEILSKLNNYVTENKINYFFNNWLTDHLEEVDQYETLFYDLFKNSNIKVVVFECYYSPCLFGLISACKRLNLKTIDIQHGVVDINYLGWNDLSTEVSNYLPEFYWVWSLADKKQTESINNRSLIKPLLGGNMWLKRFFENTHKSNNILDIKEYSKFSKRILISLQNNMFLEDTFKLIIPAIELCKENFLWMFRMHPITTPEEKLKIIELLKKYPNTEHEKTTSANLYSVLQIADVHIVASSAVALEGLQFNLPAIIIHEQGVDLFVDLIKQDIFKVALNAEELLKNITEFKSASVSEEHKIETSEQLAFNCMDTVLEQYAKAS